MQLAHHHASFQGRKVGGRMSEMPGRETLLLKVNVEKEKRWDGIAHRENIFSQNRLKGEGI